MDSERETISRRDYFAAHAPEMPQWFQTQTISSSVDQNPGMSIFIRWRWAYADMMIRSSGRE